MSALTTTLLTELVQKIGHARIEVIGGSMLPVIRPGDVLRVMAGPVSMGEIAVFNSGGHLCAHRVLAVLDGNVIARGDANKHLDAPLPCSQILGRVTCVERRGVIRYNLAPRPWASFFIRNSSIVRRIFLRIYRGETKSPVQLSRINTTTLKLGA